MEQTSYDVIVAGAGMVGSAIAYGLAGHGLRVLALDGSDGDLRAAKANFGLVWVQGKGFGNPAYQLLSRQSATLWPAFARELSEQTDTDLEFRRDGGLKFCLSDAEMDERGALLSRWSGQLPGHESCTRMLDRDALQKMLPSVPFGPQVKGASYGLLDGHVNPLKLLIALQRGLTRRGGHLIGNSAVSAIAPRTGGGFDVRCGTRRFDAARVVIAAGLGSSVLGAMVGLDVPLRAQRGQILVTERLAPLLPLPASGIRQTSAGTVMIGVTSEEVGFDLSTTTSAATRMSRQAIRVLPALAQARLVRQWACLRIMTPDGCPVYAESSDYPGASIALCHSGVTLASFHAGPFATALARQGIPADLDFFHHGRFNVPQAA